MRGKAKIDNRRILMPLMFDVVQPSAGLIEPVTKCPQYLIEAVDEVLPATDACAAIEAQVSVTLFVKDEFLDDVEHLTRL